MTRFGDACEKCKGKQEMPKVPGDPREQQPCRYCGATGRRGGR